MIPTGKEEGKCRTQLQVWNTAVQGAGCEARETWIGVEIV